MTQGAAAGAPVRFRLPVQAIVVGGLAVLAIALAYRSGLLADMLARWDDIAYLSVQHMQLVVISSGLAIVVGVPLGIALSRGAAQAFAEPVMQLLNVGTTVPTLAVLALAMTVLGIGDPPAIFALWAMTLLPIVRNAYAGLREVPAHLKEAATGMGMAPAQMLWRVELPNALYVILAGIRTALTINVGTVPLAFLIGGGGLGELIFTGIDLAEPSMMLAGAIPTALLAVAVDYLIAILTRLIVSRGVLPQG